MPRPEEQSTSSAIVSQRAVTDEIRMFGLPDAPPGSRYTRLGVSMLLCLAPAIGCGSIRSIELGASGDGDSSETATSPGTSASSSSDDPPPPDESGTDGDWGDEDDGHDDGTQFIPCPDGQSGFCDPGIQDCPDGEKCTGYVMTPGYCCVDASKCVEIIGDRQYGESCLRSPENDDCAKGLFCMTKTSGDTGEGVCLQYCDVNDESACDGIESCGGSKCLAFGDGSLPLCEVTCDPLAQDCTDPQGCYLVGAQGFVCTLPGYDDGKGEDGDECYTIQSCKPGLVCVNGETQADCEHDACCTPFCDISEGVELNPACPNAEEHCISPFEGMPPDDCSADVGLCVLPD